MLFISKWFASINGDFWTFAKVAASNHQLKIFQLFEANSQEPDELKKVVRDHRLTNKKIDISLACPGIITRIINLPVLKPKDLEVLLTDQVDQYFTLNVDDYLIDYRVLETFQEEGQTKQKVLLAAIPKMQWEEYIKLWEDLGIKPRTVDLGADAIARLYAKFASPDGQSQDLAIIELNDNRVQFIFLEHGVFFLYSDQEMDLSELQKIEQKLNDFGLNEAVLETVLTPVLQTVAEFINFFAARHFGKPVDLIYVTGAYASEQVAKVVENNLNIETKMGFPQGWEPTFAEKMAHHRPNQLKYGSLYGLAFKED